jgi:hypothetical protein
VPTTYQISTRARDGHEQHRPYTSDEPLAPGSVVVLGGRYWLVDEVGGEQAHAVPARYRLTLRHPDGVEEPGAFRRYRADAPTVGHELTTIEDGAPITWSVVEQRTARDDLGLTFLEFVADRDYDERESLPDHQLEHALQRDTDDGLSASAVVARAREAGLAVELVALDPGQAPDWDEARRFLDSLVLDEIAEGLLELCGVNPDRDPQDKWLETVKGRLADDLAAFRDDIKGDHDEIEEWDFHGGRVFAAAGRVDDDSNPLSAFGWMFRLVEADVLGAAGFERVRRGDLLWPQ